MTPEQQKMYEQLLDGCMGNEDDERKIGAFQDVVLTLVNFLTAEQIEELDTMETFMESLTYSDDEEDDDENDE